MSLPAQDQTAALHALSKAGVWDPVGDLRAIAGKHFGGNPAVDERRLTAFHADVAERCARIPLGHILGFARFASLELLVGSGSFIPRQQSLGLLRWIECNLALDQSARVYDLCAGVGAIGLAIQAATQARVVCVETDATACAYLQRNIQRLGCQRSVSLLEADVTDLEPFSADRGRVDVVVANPPYVPPEVELLPEWRIHHPAAAIYAGEQGGELVEACARLASGLLKDGAPLLIEHGENQIGQVAALLRGQGFVSVEHCVDDQYSDATGPSVFTLGRKA